MSRNTYLKIIVSLYTKCNRSNMVVYSRLYLQFVFIANIFLCFVLGSPVHAVERVKPANGDAYAPPAAKYEVTVKRNVMIPMRDGVTLATDIYFPEGEGSQWPVLLSRTPYNKDRDSSPAEFYAGQGYVVAVQDVRGKFESGGLYTVSGGSRDDGYDTVSWLSERPWSTGKVGTYGCSYRGENQYMLMAAKHPNHVAAIAEAGGGGIGSAGEYYSYFGESAGSGVPALASGIGWFWRSGLKHPQGNKKDPNKIRDWKAVYKHLPYGETIRKFKGPQTDFDAYSRDLPTGVQWLDRHGFVRDSDTFATPALHVNSWFDFSVESVVFARDFMEEKSENEAGKNQHLIVSPAGHCDSADLRADAKVGDYPVGDARYDYYQLYLDWFNYWLKGEKNNLLAETPKVTYYVMGANEWRRAEQWPPAGTEHRTYYFTEKNADRAGHVDGSLVTAPPADPMSAGFTDFTYDPLDPSPTKGGVDCCWAGVTTPIFGSFDQSEAHARSDVLYFQSSRLADPLTIAGAVDVELHVSSDAPDTDFFVRLLTVDEEGRAFNVTDKAFRARYRDGFDQETFMEPGEVYLIKFRLPDTAIKIPVGHRFAISVTSSDFPRFARNLNTREPMIDAVKARVARNRIHHSKMHSSRIILPLLTQ
ncbi:MAG: CocE/NonD family hydrolase [Pseudomonadota bacterium]